MKQSATVVSPPLPRHRVIRMQHGVSVALTALLRPCPSHHPTLYFDKRFVQCCTTKHIFRLGKNKFSLLAAHVWMLTEWPEVETSKSFFNQNDKKVIGIVWQSVFTANRERS